MSYGDYIEQLTYLLFLNMADERSRPIKRSISRLMNSSTLVQKLWNYCNVLRDDGMSYGDYVEQGGRALAAAVQPAEPSPRAVRLVLATRARRR
jgi:hypothetical protein